MTITLFDPRGGKPVTITLPDKPIAPVPPKRKAT
jgi:hypothetical protein